MSYLLGLTGSIGMGKSTTAQMFRDLGHPVWGADDAVHRLYSIGGAGVGPVAAVFPSALRNNAIDREELKKALKAQENGFERLESIIHPLVANDRQEFIKQHQNAPLIVLDIPLLFEGGNQDSFDGIAVVSTDADTQRERVLSRSGMTEEHFQTILSRQLPDAEKRAMADWVIPTSDLETARAAVEQICKEVIENA